MSVERSSRSKRVTLRGYLALAFTVPVAAAIWAFLVLGILGVVGSTSDRDPSWLKQVAAVLSTLLWVGWPVLIGGSVVLCIIGGWRGGRNRLVSALAGVFLAAPGVWILLGIDWTEPLF